MSTTLRLIVDDALNVLGEVEGAGVSTYSEDRMMRDAIRTFNLLFKKYYWPNYMEWFRVQLDGTLGIVPADTFDHVRDIEDIQAVFRDGETKPLPTIPRSVNPYSLTDAGTRALYWSFLPVTSQYYENRLLQFWPKTATDYVNVHARVYPRENGVAWDWSDEIHLDHDMMVCGTAWHTLASDDINPGAQDAQRNLMEMRYKDILAAFANQPIAMHAGTGIPTRWSEVP
jgi:hypothetical protein